VSVVEVHFVAIPSIASTVLYSVPMPNSNENNIMDITVLSKGGDDRNWRFVCHYPLNVWP
jgi:hypothetical protein